MTATSSTMTLVGARESETAPLTTLVASGPPSGIAVVTSPSQGSGENELFAATTSADGSTWVDGGYIEPSTGNHETLTEQGMNGQWSIVPSPNPGANGDNGLAGITAIPGGGLWAVGIATNTGNPSVLIEHHL